MNLKMIRPKNETEDLLLSKLKIAKHLLNKLIPDQKKHWNSNSTNQQKRFTSIQQIQNKGDWMTGLTSLEVYNSIFNINKTNNKFEL